MEASRAFRPEEPTSGTDSSARQRLALLSLVELTGTISRARDIHGIVDALLLNLMGHFGTARSAVWLKGPRTDDPPAPIRSHGISRSLSTVLVTTAWVELEQQRMSDREPFEVANIWRRIGLNDPGLAAQAGVELMVPLRAESRFLGVLLLGPRIGQKVYAPFDLEMIRASAAMAGLAIQNADLQARALESNRRQRAALEEMAKLDELKTQFVSNVNHELRTPLALIQASLECLETCAPGSEQSKSLLDVSRRGVQNLSRLIQQLLSYSDSARRNFVVNPTWSDLHVFLGEYVNERRPGISAGLRELALESDGAPRRTSFDEALLRQVLDELVDNAFKFSPPGSRIRLGLDDHVEDGAPWRRIDVEDNGRGIAAAAQATLFEEFRQVDGSSTRTVGGLGLGLPLTRKLVTAMGGRMSVRSAEGEGSVFTVLLPAP